MQSVSLCAPASASHRGDTGCQLSNTRKAPGAEREDVIVCLCSHCSFLALIIVHVHCKWVSWCKVVEEGTVCVWQIYTNQIFAVLEPSWTMIHVTTTLHSFNNLFSRTTYISWHQEDKPFWILLEQEMIGWQWHHLDHMQIICTSLQTDNHASSSPLSFYRLDPLPAAQPTASCVKAL